MECTVHLRSRGALLGYAVPDPHTGIRWVYADKLPHPYPSDARLVVHGYDVEDTAPVHLTDVIIQCAAIHRSMDDTHWLAVFHGVGRMPGWPWLVHVHFTIEHVVMVTHELLPLNARPPSRPGALYAW